VKHGLIVLLYHERMMVSEVLFQYWTAQLVVGFSCFSQLRVHSFNLGGDSEGVIRRCTLFFAVKMIGDYRKQLHLVSDVTSTN
jgi:hypothetical protein